VHKINASLHTKKNHRLLALPIDYQHQLELLFVNTFAKHLNDPGDKILQELKHSAFADIQVFINSKYCYAIG